MDVQQKLDDIAATVRGAKSMPMSASCVVNRSELLAMLEEVRGSLPDELLVAQQTLAEREELVEAARREAEQIIHGAHGERGALISETEVVRRAQAEADRVLAEARAEAEEQRRSADDYVDAQLANFEVVLNKTLGAIGRGRNKLRNGGLPVPGEEQAEDGEEFTPDPYRSPSPEVDEYVDAKLATLETVLGKTLEAVGKGRDKLTGKAPIDELGAYLAEADAGHPGRASEIAAALAEAGLTGDPEPVPAAQSAGRSGADQHAVDPHPADQQQWYTDPVDPAAGWPGHQDVQQPDYGYQQQPYQDYGSPAGYEQQAADPYAAGYAQQANAFPPQQYDYPAAAGYPDSGYQGQHGADPHQADQHGRQPQGLDETSLFDTGFIDMSRLKELGG
ncbi:hypothetical protein [Phaeacidiphilus oryzae]|uniref:hypothetical protein n=1 Tax=Phaeacidiphilus oryzae TaxID=348818 RepID=UPI0005684439|nr:hypothetical protein [Phaeacidiphilus oryzae]